MGDLSKNFSLHEFRCKDGTAVPEELRDNLSVLVENLQILRDRLDVPITVISGYRSETYNRRCGGVRFSQHLLALAADVRAQGHSSADLQGIVIEMIKSGEIKNGGIGVYPSFLHYDCRSGRAARWRGSKG